MYLEVVVSWQLPDTVIQLLVAYNGIRDLVTTTGEGSSTTTTSITTTTISYYTAISSGITITIGIHIDD